jgi:hypothetical protein
MSSKTPGKYVATVRTPLYPEEQRGRLKDVSERCHMTEYMNVTNARHPQSQRSNRPDPGFK